MLAAYLLMVQRDLAGLSLADVAARLGAASGNAYAAYERGEREPSISKLRELLAAVNPELVLTVSQREIGSADAAPEANLLAVDPPPANRS